jgi:hypothetical protein
MEVQEAAKRLLPMIHTLALAPSMLRLGLCLFEDPVDTVGPDLMQPFNTGNRKGSMDASDCVS